MGTRRKKHPPKKQPKPRQGVRSFWSGTISFGLVSVPVNVFPAHRRTSVSFRLLDKHGTPLARRYYCPQDKADVHPEHILRGYPVEGDEYVIVRDEELEALEPKKTREIDLRRFVDLAEISPMYFERTYFLTPSGESNKAYRLLAEVMEESGRAGIATFVMRDREYLIAILSENGILRAETLRFQDEIRSIEAVGLPGKERTNRSEVARLARAIKKLTVDELDPDWMKDEYAERVLRLVEKKRQQRKNVVEIEHAAAEDEAREADDVPEVDLLETIRQSLKGRGAQGNGRHRSRSDHGWEHKSKDELYERAKHLHIPGRSKLSKRELIRELQRAESES